MLRAVQFVVSQMANSSKQTIAANTATNSWVARTTPTRRDGRGSTGWAYADLRIGSAALASASRSVRLGQREGGGTFAIVGAGERSDRCRSLSLSFKPMHTGLHAIDHMACGTSLLQIRAGGIAARTGDLPTR